MYKEGQRWISETEPELGLGTLLQIGKERVSILFSAKGELRQYAIQSAPLRRVCFRIGDRIEDNSGCAFRIESIQEKDGLLTYRGEDRAIEETQLNDRISFSRPEERLFAAHCDDLAAHHLRARALQNRFCQDQSPLRGFVGGRIELIPHQLYIANEVASRHAPRVLLSDEVGLGKTIEASLILHRLLISGRAARILIVVPESLVHQWFVELLRKFNLRMDLFDEERCCAIEGERLHTNPFLESPLILCATALLSKSKRRLSQAIAAGWDLLIVDEAHHLEWSETAPSGEYLAIESLSKQTEGLLLLTATPEQLGAQSHFARLRLLDPDRYPSYENFQNQSEHYAQIARLADRLSKGTLNQIEKNALQQYLDKNVKLQNETDRGKALARLLDLHGLGRVIFRNTRAVIRGFPKRIAKLIPIKASDARALKQAAMEFAADAENQTLQKDFSLNEDPRLRWLVALLRELSSEKILLICRTKQKALALDAALAKHINAKSSVFHEDLSLIVRDRNAAYFSQEEGAQILICSEIGSEGRNFQFAHHLVLFDLPIHPERLEQRIGRLDRIGQKRDIRIYIPYLAGSPQEVLSLWYHDALDAFQTHLIGGHWLYQKFHKQLRAFALKYPTLSQKDRNASLSSFLKKSKSERLTLSRRLEKGRNRLLEMSSFQPEIANEITEQIHIEDASFILENFMSDVFEHYGVQVEEIDSRTYRLCPSGVITDAFPAIPKEGMLATYDRKRALSREDMGFLSWDHPIVIGAMDLILGSELGNCCFAFWHCKKHGFLLDATFELTAIAPSKWQIERFFPRTPIRIIINHQMKNIDPKSIPSPDSDALQDASPYRFLDDETMKNALLPAMLSRAEALAEDRAEAIAELRNREMASTLDAEISRLGTLKKAGYPIRSIEIDLAQTQKKRLQESITKFTLRLDSIRVIVLVPQKD